MIGAKTDATPILVIGLMRVFNVATTYMIASSWFFGECVRRKVTQCGR
jgi:hypothetical protein